jgi:hypothetical protein
VDIFSEGFDCPDIEVVQIVKPTKSLVKYLQMVGRVTRTFKGKRYGIILDNSCLWQDHGLVTNNREWFLNASTKETFDYDALIFSDGSSGSDAYKRKLKELFNIDMIEVDKAGIEDETVFTTHRLSKVRAEYKVGWKTLTKYLNEINFDLYENLTGSSTNPDKRKISQKLYDIIDWKFGSNKGLDGITL